jgi:hypothetical protein
MYTTNELLSHPLVSPVMQPTLGGLPPLLIMVGGGEVLRDEQIYLAHKCADPAKYAPPDEFLSEVGRAQLKQFRPTDVQLQVWDDLCHVAPTLSFTRPAKFMYRSIAQFGAWALARAQKTGIDILDDDAISVVSNSESEDQEAVAEADRQVATPVSERHTHVGKAGDPLPPFKNHMIRQRVTRHGLFFPLAPATELEACIVKHGEVGVIKATPVRKWMEMKKRWDSRYANSRAKIRKQIVKDMLAGYLELGDGESPPPSALVGRRKRTEELAEKKKTKSMGLALWSLWGSKHDEMTVVREQKADQEPEAKVATEEEGAGATPFQEIQEQKIQPKLQDTSRTRSRRRTVVDEHQTEGTGAVDDNTPVAELLKLRKEKEAGNPSFLSLNYVPETGVAGKRPMLDGIALPFSLKKEADTASMMTLTSGLGADSRPISPMPPTSPVDAVQPITKHQDSGVGVDEDNEPENASEPVKGENIVAVSGSSSPDVAAERPGLETFVTAAKELPKAE